MTWKLYEHLGVTKETSKDDIKKAYKKKALETHPDRGGNPEEFKLVNNAYSVLTDDDTRARYDQLGDEGFNASGGANGMASGMNVDPNDIFRQFFGGGFNFHFQPGHQEPQRHKCADHKHIMKIGMSDAYTGIKKIMRIVLRKTCMKCRERCYSCQGRGQITEMRRMGFFTQMQTRDCDRCNGSGMSVRPNSGCTGCSGSGNYNEEKLIEADIPAGVDMGYTVSFNGMGEQPKKSEDIPGDLHIEIFIHPHEKFVRQGKDLHLKIPVSFKDSVIGTTVDIYHFTSVFHINTAELGILQPSKQYVVKGKGMPVMGSTDIGNMVITFDIQYPSMKITPENSEKIKELFDEIGI